MPNSRLHLKIFGQVQGVNFRFYAKQEADKLGLKGWVKNDSDGSVECVAEGERGALEKFLDWCRIGPPGALVEKVDLYWEDAKGDFSIFEIKF